MAFTFLLDRYWNEVYGFMLKRTENETDSEDITIETFSKAFDKIATYNPEFQAEDELITEQNLSRLLQFIKELKPHYQEVIQLRYFQEMSYQEISEQLNEPLSNVKIKLLRAKKLLAEIIESKK